MATSRRQFIAWGSLAGGGLIAAHVGGASVFAQDDTRAPRPPRRRSLKGMAADDPVIVAWREAVGKLKAPGAVAPFTWPALASIHGTSAGFNKCPHGNWYFLPWHRAYLTMYERKVRELTSFPGFALPYWDWTNEPTLPPAFTAQTVNGQPNHLFSARTLSGALPTQIVGPAVITQILGQTPFETFGTSRPSGQNDLSQSWITSRTGIQGTLENNPHNQVHNLVGGLMRSTQSPLDAIFMMHHCNIDRLWAVWRAAGHANSTDPLWTDMPFTAHFFNSDGTPWSPKVSDLFVPETLGYTYALRRRPLLTGPAAPAPRWQRFERLFQLRPGETAEGIDRSTSAVRDTASRTRPLAVPVPVNAERLAPIMGRGFRGAGEDVLDIAGPSADEPLAPRTVALIRNLAITREENTEFRVFLNQPDLSAATPVSAPGYVGSFGFFGGHAGHGDAKPSVMMDLTDAIGRVFAAGATPTQLNLQIQPVALAGMAAASAGTAAPESIEVAIVQP